jgi:AAA+ ATPase superfamily predicted ATPase
MKDKKEINQEIQHLKEIASSQRTDFLTIYTPRSRGKTELVKRLFRGELFRDEPSFDQTVLEENTSSQKLSKLF